MELRQLQYFLAVAEQLNFSKAAEILYVTQPLLSQQIADLESQLGTALFFRSRRNVSLTPAGVALYREAGAIFERLHYAVANVRDTPQTDGTGAGLNVGFEIIFPRAKLTDAVSGLRVTYPGAEMKITRMTAGKLLASVNRGQVDVGFFTFPSNGFDSDCDFCILDCRWLSVVASRHVVVDRSIDGAKRLLSEKPIYLMDRDSRELNMVVQVCNALGVSPVLNFTDNLENVLAYVESGMGIALLSENLLNSYGSDNLVSIPLDGIQPARVCEAAVWKSGNGNAMIPLLLQRMTDSSVLCDGACGKSCSLSKI